MLRTTGLLIFLYYFLTSATLFSESLNKINIYLEDLKAVVKPRPD